MPSWKDPAAVAAGTWTNYDVATANQMLDAAGLKRGADGTRLDQDGKPMEYRADRPIRLDRLDLRLPDHQPRT